MTERISGKLFAQMVINASVAVEADKEKINELNVFPVPDGDTGTNMSLTISSGAAALRDFGDDTIEKASAAAANAFLRGARGNSGVILSLLFRGIANQLRGHEDADAQDIALALTNGVTSAYKAVMKPTEGTILTVSRLSAAAAKEAAAKEPDIEKVFECAIETGRIALENTVNQNPVLKKAGVIDAGGMGYVRILEAMLAAMRGEMFEAIDGASAPASASPFSAFRTEDITFTYCTEFIVERRGKKDVGELRDYLSGIGDSLVVVDDSEIIKVHVHTNNPGEVLTHALEYGPLASTKIENMRLQHTERLSLEKEEEPAEAAPSKKYGIVAVCAGEGLQNVFRELGADGVITGGQTMNPSTDDILSAVQKTPAEIVFVLPNNKNIIMAAQQCQDLTEKTVVVIPTKTVPQGVSAMLSFDPALDAEELERAMKETAENVRTTLNTYAARDSEFDGHSIKSGEYLALLDGSLTANGPEIDEIIGKVSESFVQFEPNLITVYFGEDVAEADADKVCAKLETDFPDAEVTPVNGGQPVYYYMIAAE